MKFSNTVLDTVSLIQNRIFIENTVVVVSGRNFLKNLIFWQTPLSQWVVITIPRQVPYLPVLAHFTRVTPKTTKTENEVYVLNRAILTNSIKIRESQMDDVAQLTRLNFDLGDQVQGFQKLKILIFSSSKVFNNS